MYWRTYVMGLLQEKAKELDEGLHNAGIHLYCNNARCDICGKSKMLHKKLVEQRKFVEEGIKHLEEK